MALETCATCHRAVPRPAVICTQCGVTAPTFYCDTTCRDRDSSNRNHLDRHVVYRTGDLARDIFFTFREAAFDLKVKKLQKRGGVLHVYEGNYQLGNGVFAGPLFKFPEQLVPDPEDRARLLSVHACTEAIAYTYELCKLLLGSVPVSVEEAYFTPIRGSRSTVRYHSEGNQDLRDDNNYAHSVLIVETEGGESYVLDIAGAQNGQFEAVVPVDTFIDREQAKMTQLHPHGRDLSQIVRMVNGTFALGKDNDISAIQILYQVHRQIEGVIQEWEKGNKVSLQKLVREAPQKLYEQSKTSLLAKVSTSLKAYVAQWEKEGKILETLTDRAVIDGMPTIGQNSCTIEPKGKGSRAYQIYLEHNKPPPRNTLNEEIEAFWASGGNTEDLLDGLSPGKTQELVHGLLGLGGNTEDLLRGLMRGTTGRGGQDGHEADGELD